MLSSSQINGYIYSLGLGKILANHYLVVPCTQPEMISLFSLIVLGLEVVVLCLSFLLKRKTPMKKWQWRTLRQLHLAVLLLIQYVSYGCLNVLLRLWRRCNEFSVVMENHLRDLREGREVEEDQSRIRELTEELRLIREQNRKKTVELMCFTDEWKRTRFEREVFETDRLNEVMHFGQAGYVVETTTIDFVIWR